jgi:hypothetical protein
MSVDGTWINQNGSTVELAVDRGGTVSGHYMSRKGRAAAGKRYPITGRVNEGVIAFQVDWQDRLENLNAITSFSGRIGRDAEGLEVIHTVWVLVRQWEDAERTRQTGLWNAFLTNSDVFYRADQAA